MEYKKIIGVVSEERTGSARIQVVAFRDNKGQLNRSIEKIKQHFPPHGCVFGPSFFDRYEELKISDFIEFKVNANNGIGNDDNPDKDQMILDTKNNPKQIGYFVIELNEDILMFDHSVNQVVLQEQLPYVEGINRFYFSYGSRVYGSFKVKNGMIIPTKGKTIKVWESIDEAFISHNEKTILLAEPKSNYRELDSMTIEQLAKWFSGIIAKEQSDLSNAIKEQTNWKNDLNTLLQSEKDDLAKARLQKVIGQFSKLNFSLDTIKQLSQSDDKWQAAYVGKIEEYKEELKRELEFEVDDALEEKRQEIKDANGQVKSIRADMLELFSEIGQKKNELTYLQKEKERIINDIRISAPILMDSFKGSNEVIKEAIHSYTFDECINDFDRYTTKKSFLEEFKKQLIKRGYYDNNLEKKAFDVLAEHKCVMIPDIQVVLAFIEASNNSVYLIQQVEPDWIKFRFLWENGLAKILDSCIQRPDKLHFLILQDINLASPECWGKPLFDINRGVRKKFPNTDINWPANFKVIGTKISTSDPEIGLPILEQTFKEWGGIPRIDHDDEVEQESENIKGVLHLDILEDINQLSSNNINTYYD